ncbi:MAG: HupE/UreJ family protein [Myxococcota bacterium]|nr:HupE/UreJ family protein [Myxococcota bacterium]
MIRACAAIAGCLVLAASLAPEPLHAHARSTSWSSHWIEGREARIVLRVPQLELTRLPFGTVTPPALDPRLAEYVVSRVGIRADGEACSLVAPPRALRAPAERAAIEWEVRCPEAGRLEVVSRFLQDVAPTHLHFARVRLDRAPPDERVLTEEASTWALGAEDASGEASPARGVLAYLGIGIEHILKGADHLVFLLGLLLLASRLGEVVRIVTGFTVAHSLTLGLAAVGAVRPESGAVEALIGLSIVIVAAENAWLLAGRPRFFLALLVTGGVGLGVLAALGIGSVPAAAFLGLSLFTLCTFLMGERSERPERIRFAIALAFGLVHGFGFAGVLAEFELPQERLLPALLGFNLGVEVGQLGVVLLAWPALRAIARFSPVERVFAETATAAVCAAGMFWLVSRTYA